MNLTDFNFLYELVELPFAWLDLLVLDSLFRGSFIVTIVFAIYAFRLQSYTLNVLHRLT